MNSDEKDTVRNIIYIPPSPETIDKLVRQACRAMGGEYAKPEFIFGLSAFLKTVVDITTRHLNSSE